MAEHDHETVKGGGDVFVAFQGHGDGTRRLTTAAAIALAIGFAASAGAAQEHIFDCIIDPSATVLVGSPVPGLLEQVLVDRGDFVEQGQIVARLESHLDLYGNAHFAFGNVYIERSVPDRPKSETRSLRSLFTPKAAAILRVLLRDPARAWRVTDLAETANASLGHVSNVRKALLDREWIAIRDDGLVLVQPDTLLKSWRENYRQPAGHHISGYTLLHGDQLRNTLSGKLNPGPQPPRAICASNSAAQWFAHTSEVAHTASMRTNPGLRC